MASRMFRQNMSGDEIIQSCPRRWEGVIFVCARRGWRRPAPRLAIKSRLLNVVFKINQ